MMRKKITLCLLFILTLTLIKPNHYNYATNTLNIDSSSAILIDARTGSVLYEKNGFKEYFPASITKLMTALLTIENLSPNDTITFSNNAVLTLPRGTSNIGIKPNEVLTVDQALHGLLLMSANEIANGLAEEISGSIEAFAEKMNERARELGAHNTNFINPHGLHNENHYTTAYDMALITMALYDTPYFKEIMSNITYQIPETNQTDEVRFLSQQHRLMNQIRDAAAYREDVIGGKTGYTSAAGHTLVTIAQKNEMILITVIMGSNANSVYQDTNKILDFGFDTFKNLQIGPELHKAPLTLPIFTIVDDNSIEVGNAEISVAAFSPLIINSDANTSEITTDISLPDFLSDTIAQGDIVGTLSYYYKNRLLGNSDLIVDRINLNELQVLEEASQQSKTFSWIKYPLLILIGAVYYLNKAKKNRKRNSFRYYRQRRYRY